MASNLTSGNNQSYDPGEGARILDGLNPDVVMMQEFNIGGDTTSDYRSFVTNTFGSTYSYFVQSGSGIQIPNGIISRYPIISSGVWDDTSVSNRDFVWARIDVPGNRDLWAISVHLLTDNSSRPAEATHLLSLIQANVPAGDFLAIGGDFNADSRTETALNTLSNAVITTGPYPVDRNGNANTNAGRNSPYDGVYVDSDLSAYKTSVVIGGSVFANGLVADTRVYTPISEISPALTTDSDASMMQHMGVVRDFLIPVPEPATAALLSGGFVLLIARRRQPRC